MGHFTPGHGSTWNKGSGRTHMEMLLVTAFQSWGYGNIFFLVLQMSFDDFDEKEKRLFLFFALTIVVLLLFNVYAKLLDIM